MWLLWLRVSDLGWSQWATLRDLAGVSLAEVGGSNRERWLLVSRGSGSGGGLLDGWNVEDVELATSGLLHDEFLGWVMRDVVAVDDVVVPVSGTWLQSVRGLEAEGTFPATWLGRRVLGGERGERELRGVVVPAAEEMDGTDG